MQFRNGDRIGDYRILGYIGQGGMGEVYQGVHEKLDRLVAIKVLNAGVTDPSFNTRFINEARVHAVMHHPNIAALYDFREVGGRLHIFMEYVGGDCLEDVIHRRDLNIDQSLRIFQAICDAVEYCHRNGVVHRDLKSQNIKLTPGGAVKLLDFGIAKDASTHGVTRVGGVIGTPNYLAPEQLSGQPASPATDIWSLGVLLYEMLTGRMPFQNESLQALVGQVLSGRFTPPEDINPAVPRAVSKIVHKALERDPADRYKEVGEMRRDLERYLENPSGAMAGLKGAFGFKTAPARTPSKSVSLPEFTVPALPARKFPALLVATGSVAALLVLFVIVGGGMWFLSSGSTANANAPAKQDNKQLASRPQAKGTPKQVKIDVYEGKAVVVRDGAVLGTTPLYVETAPGESVSLTLRSEGFEDKVVNVEATTQKKDYTVTMKRK